MRWLQEKSSILVWIPSIFCVDGVTKKLMTGTEDRRLRKSSKKCGGFPEIKKKETKNKKPFINLQIIIMEETKMKK